MSPTLCGTPSRSGVRSPQRALYKSFVLAISQKLGIYSNKLLSLNDL